MEKRKPKGFIRKGGRIIPIFDKKLSKKQKTGISGAGSLAGGMSLTSGLAYAAGKTRKNLVQSGLKVKSSLQNVSSSMSFMPSFGLKGGQLDMFTSSSKPNFARGIKDFDRVGKRIDRLDNLHKIAGRSYKASRLGSAALVGVGVERLLDSVGYNDSALSNDIGGEYFGVLGAAANDSLGRAFFNKGHRGTPVSKSIKLSARRGLSSFYNSQFSLDIIKKLAKRKFRL